MTNKTSKTRSNKQRGPYYVDIIPAGQLIFTGPFSSAKEEHLHIKNNMDRKVAFKVRTSTPKQYLVRPNSGFLEAEQSVAVAITLQPMTNFDSADPPKHRFQIQAFPAEKADTNRKAFWMKIMNSPPENLQETKLRVRLQEEAPIKTEQDAVITPTEPDKDVQLQHQILERTLKCIKEDVNIVKGHVEELENENKKFIEELEKADKRQTDKTKKQSFTAWMGKGTFIIVLLLLVIYTATYGCGSF